MGIASSRLHARVTEADRRERMWRVVKAVLISLVTCGAGLVLGFATGLHDARWSDARVNLGQIHRYSAHSAADAATSCPSAPS